MNQPWIKSSYNSFGIIRLHEEIKDFCNYIQPTKLEYEIRNSIINKVENIIVTKWSQCKVRVFGSFANGLFAPTSDIDIVLFGKWVETPLKTVKKLLDKSDFAEDVRVINATIPIVKFIDKQSQISVDISFNKEGGLKNIPFIKNAIEVYPDLRCLFLVLKQFLFIRDLSEAYTGGMGSYCLMMLCISYFQHHNVNYSQSMNLGVLLMEFFELYGKNLNYLNTGLIIAGKGRYIKRRDNLESERPALLYVQDPMDESINVGRSCYMIHSIRYAFGYALTHLHKRVVPSLMIENSNKCIKNESILGCIVWVDNNCLERRELYKSKFGHLVNNEESDMSPKVPSIVSNPVSAVQSLKRKLPDRKSKNIKNFVPSNSRSKNSKKNDFYKTRRPQSWNDLLSWSKSNVFNQL